MKCPVCEIGTLTMYADSCTRFQLEKRGDKIAAIRPYTTTIYDEERGIDCGHCGVKISSEIDEGDTEKLVPIWDAVEIIEENGDECTGSESSDVRDGAT